jgi:hypothetical protein
VAKDRYAVLLSDGDTWIWKHEDDLANKHASIVNCPPQLPAALGLLSRPLFLGRCPGCAPPKSPLPHVRHGVWFPSRLRGEARSNGVRWAFMFRWSNGRKRSFDQTYPHRLQLTEAEKEQVAARQAAAAAKAARWSCPPEPTRPPSKRACKAGK